MIGLVFQNSVIKSGIKNAKNFATTRICSKTWPAGFEPAHAEHNGLAVHPRNHLGTATDASSNFCLKFKNAIYFHEFMKAGKTGNRTRVSTATTWCSAPKLSSHVVQIINFNFLIQSCSEWSGIRMTHWQHRCSFPVLSFPPVYPIKTFKILWRMNF